MSWITENAWPLIVVCLTLGVMSAVMFGARGRLVALGFILAAGLFWWIEAKIVTESEVLEKDLQTLLDAFKHQDETAIHGHISAEAPNLKSIATQGMNMVKLDPAFHMKDIQITLSDEGQTATAHLRANGRAALKNAAYDQTVATRWETTWKKEAGRWKLRAVRRLDVVSGQEMGILDAG